MEITLELIVFTVLALFIGVSAILAVTTRRILRAATYLLFVLFGTAGIYFQLNYSFLGAVQLLIYAGGITVLYVFSILLTSSEGDKAERLKGYKLFVGLGAALASLGICLWITLRHDFLPSHFEHGELHVRTIGHALMSSGKYGYILPFEVISLLLLLILLLLRVIRVDHIREKSDFLLGNLGFFFIPVSVSIMNYVDLLWQHAAAFLTVCVVSMVLTYGATVWAVRLTQRLMDRGGKRK